MKECFFVHNDPFRRKIYYSLIINFDGKKLCYKGVIRNLIGTRVCVSSITILIYYLLINHFTWLIGNQSEQINNQIIDLLH